MTPIQKEAFDLWIEFHKFYDRKFSAGQGKTVYPHSEQRRDLTKLVKKTNKFVKKVEFLPESDLPVPDETPVGWKGKNFNRTVRSSLALLREGNVNAVALSNVDNVVFALHWYIGEHKWDWV